MSDTEAQTIDARATQRPPELEMRFELVVIPVSDVERAKSFYANLGWRLDLDFAGHADYRVVQFTPPGSPASIIFGRGITLSKPGSAHGLYVVVSDIVAARAKLLASNVAVGALFHDGGGVFHHADGKGVFSGLAPERRSYGTYAAFTDPDGNQWFLQEVTSRLPGHEPWANTTFNSAIELAGALRRAQAAHDAHEKRMGRQDDDWSAWYADHIVSEQGGKPLPQ